MKTPFFKTAFAVAAAALTCASLAAAANPLSPAQSAALRLKSSGVSVAVCPSYVANPRSGLYTSINTANTVCVRAISGKKAVAAMAQNIRVPLVLDGKLKGSGFETLDQQGGNDGDVDSGLFKEVNYPVGVFFELENADYTATYTLNIKDGISGTIQKTAFRGSVPASGWVDWLGIGSYFFNIAALPDKNGNQPIFHVEMQFMDTYIGSAVSAAQMAHAHMKTVSCPSYLYDIYGRRLYTLRGMSCTTSFNPSSAGFTAAPYNLNTGLYLTQVVSPFVANGASQGFPFRIRKPTLLAYQVDDPAVSSGQQGTTYIQVKDLTTNQIVNSYHVQGTVSLTQTSLNIPGDYYISVTTYPVDRTKYGEIGWQVSLQGSD